MTQVIEAPIATLHQSGIFNETETEVLSDIAAASSSELLTALERVVSKVSGINPEEQADDAMLELLISAAAVSKAIKSELEERRGSDEKRKEELAALRVSITASATSAEKVATASSPRLPSVAQLARRRPASHRPLSSNRFSNGPMVLTASGELATESLVEVVGEAMRKELRNAPTKNAKVLLASLKVETPDELTLGADVTANESKLDNLVEGGYLVASGGICGPVDVDFSVSTFAATDRPVRNALPRFASARGGVRFVRPAQLTDLGSASTLWTNANDLSPSNPTTKPHATYTCPTVQEATVDAITALVQFGNFQARYEQEQIQNFVETAFAQQARLAEASLLASIASGSRAVTAGINLLGISRDLLAEVDRASAGIRYRNRLSPTASMRLLAPDWVRQAMKADLAREMPGDSGGGTERLATSDAEITAMFEARGINVSFYLDNPTGAAVTQGFPVQGVGMLVPWPTKAIMYLFPEASWLFLDGGTLDLGMVRDSTLNQTNDVQMFSETFEKAVFRGVESLQITADTCVSGQAANLVDTSSLCTSGS